MKALKTIPHRWNLSVPVFYLAKLFFKSIFSLQIEGLEYLEGQKGIILAGNRIGFGDRWVLRAAFTRPLAFAPFKRGFGHSAKEAARILKKSQAVLAKGQAVCVFPQGRPAKDTGLSFHRGVAQLRESAKVPVVPFALSRHGRIITLHFGQVRRYDPKTEAEFLSELHEQVEFMKESLERRYRPRRDRLFQESVFSLMMLKADTYGPRIATSLKEGDRWNELTFTELARKARNLSDYLLEWGIKRGDRVSILSESRPEWGIAFFSIVRAGGVLVPLDIKLTSAEMCSILQDSEPRILFVSREYAEKGKALKVLIPSLERLILLDQNPWEDLPPYESLKASGEYRGRLRTPEETALLIYTSGTTGNPKGVMISFGNLIHQVQNFNEILDLNRKDVYLSILPLNHLFELTTGLMGVLHAGGSICYLLNLYPQEIAKTMREKKITGMIAVPSFLKMLKNSIEKEIRKGGAGKERLFKILYEAAAWMPWIGMRRLMFGPIHRQFGGRMKQFVSGGAPLDIEVCAFFDRIGMPVYQGYGLTETSPVISVNTPGKNRIGSVGHPIKGVTVEILKKEGEEEGEIISRGSHIMKGYYKRPDLTREVIDEHEWFHTGDLGRIDKDGYLYITGRIKNLIVLSGGKKVHPEEVETCLARSSLLKESAVVGFKFKGVEEVIAVLVPADALMEEHRHDLKRIEPILKREVIRLGQDLAQYKRPARIFIHAQELPKTATRKVKRREIMQWLEVQALETT